MNTIKQKYSYGGFIMKKIVLHNTSMIEKKEIEERSINLAHYIIESKDTVRGAARKFGISKSTVHKDVTLQNGLKNRYVIPKSIEIKKVFLAEKNPVVKLGLLIK